MAWKRARTYRVLLENRRGCGIDLEDFAQCGRIGIWEAIKRFDPKRSNKFAVVAHLWIHAKEKRIAQDLNSGKRAANAVKLPDGHWRNLIWMDKEPE